MGTKKKGKSKRKKLSTLDKIRLFIENFHPPIGG